MRIKWIDTCKSFENNALLKQLVVFVLDVVIEFRHASRLIDDSKSLDTEQNQESHNFREKKTDYETGINYQDLIRKYYR